MRSPFVRSLFRCLGVWAMLVVGVPMQAQQDDFDPVLPPDPAATYSVSVSSAPKGAAVLTGGGALCAGAATLLSCTPAEGYAFDYWSLDGVQYSTDLAFTYTVEHRSVAFVAHLHTIAPHTLSLSSNLPDAAVLTGAGSYYPAHTVQIGCTPREDYYFQYWTLNGEVYSHDSCFSYTMGSADAAFVAVFAHTPRYTVTAQADDAAAGYVVASEGRYLEGETISLEAHAYSEYLFSHWTLNGSYLTNQSAFTYTVGAAAAAFVAVFDFDPEQPDDPAVEMTTAVYLKAEPKGAATFNISSGTKYREGDTLIVRATMADDYIFDGWYRGDDLVASTTAFTYIVGQSDVTFTLRATPVVYSQLNLVASPAEAVTFNIRSGNIYREHTVVSLRASVVAGYAFSGWYWGDSLLCETVDLRYTIGAKAVTLTARATIITPDPDEEWNPLPPSDPDMESVYIIAQSANSATGKAYGSASYVVGKEVTLRAVAAHGYVFSRWSDGNTDSVRVVIATVDTTYTAYFTPLTYTVSVVSDDAVAGKVSGGGTYAYRSSATLRATPATGYSFVRWSDESTDLVHTVYITSDTLFTAYFAPISYVVTVRTADDELGSVTGGGTYTMGDVATLTATPLNYSTFLQWDDGNTDNPRTITVSGDAEYIALFLPYSEPEHPEGEGQLTGKFQVSPTRYVVFAQGNLQYNAANGEKHKCADGTWGQGTWRLADNQYDCIGLDNAEADEAYDGWIDIFGWGTSGWMSGAKAYQPWCVSEVSTDFQPYNSESDLTLLAEYADWGVYNAVYNGGNRTNEWRVLTADEWQYLFRYGRWTMARIKITEKKSLRGFLMLPVGFSCPAGVSVKVLGTGNETSSQKTISQGEYSSNLYTLEQFALLQEAGVVFLPCAGFRDAGEVDYVNMVGGYWSSTAAGEQNARALYFFSNMVDANYLPLRSFGYSVRLVSEVEAPVVPTDMTVPQAADTPSAARKVLRDGQFLILRDGNAYTALGVSL